MRDAHDDDQAISPARLQWVLDKAALRDEALTPWEREFLASMGERLDTYGNETFISEGQARALARIAEKVG